MEQSIEETGSCPDDERVIDLWNKRFRVLDGHLELPIQWKDPHATLPDNLYLAKRRLGNLLKSMKRKGMMDMYDLEI